MTYREAMAADLAVFVVSLKNGLTYRASRALTIAMTIVWALIYIAVWYAVYTFSGSSAIGGISLVSMIAYFLITGAISMVGWWGVINRISDDVQQGTMIRSFIRPMGYLRQLFVSALPDDLITFGFGAAPIVALTVVFGGLDPGALAVALFAVQIVIAYLVVNLIGFIVGSMSVYLTNIWGIANALSTVFAMLGGGVVPLLLFPSSAVAVLMLTPLPLLLYVPAATLLGMMTTWEAIGSIAVGAAWLAGLVVASRLVWSKVMRAMNAVGV